MRGSQLLPGSLSRNLLLLILLLLFSILPLDAQDTPEPEITATDATTLPAEEEPTAETPTEIPVTETEPTAETPTEPAPAVTTEPVTELTAVPTEEPASTVELSPEPGVEPTVEVSPNIPVTEESPVTPAPLPLAYSASFDTGFPAELGAGTGWLVVAVDAGQALQNASGAQSALYQPSTFNDTEISARVLLNAGSVELIARKSAAGNYSAVLVSDGTLKLTKNGELLNTGVVTLTPGAWVTLKLSVVGGTLTAYVDNAAIVTASDFAPLPSGQAGFGVHADSLVRVDDVAIYGVADGIPEAVPTEATLPDVSSMSSEEPELPPVSLMSFDCPVDPTALRLASQHNGTQLTGALFTDLIDISADGRYTVFSNADTTVFPGDNNLADDAFRFDATTCSLIRISVTHDGGQPNGQSYPISISDDGNLVLYASRASNIIDPDTAVGTWQFYVRDVTAGTTEIVSVDSSEAPAVSASASSNYFQPNGSMSSDGRFVVFTSIAENLVAGDSNNFCETDFQDSDPGTAGTQYDNNENCPDVFLRDRQNGTTIRVSVANNGDQANGVASMIDAPRVSDNGQYVAFSSYATNLTTDTTLSCANTFFNPTSTVCAEIYVRNTVSNTTQRVSVSDTEQPGNGPNNIVTPGGEIPFGLRIAMSADGRYIAFASSASNLVTGDTNGKQDVFVRDIVAGTTTLVSRQNNGTQFGGHSFSPTMTENGDQVVFIAGDLTSKGYVRRRSTEQTVEFAGVINPAFIEVADDGGFIAIATSAGMLAGDSRPPDVYVMGYTYPVPPNTPTNLQVTGTTKVSASLSWTDTSSDETSFGIERRIGQYGTWAQIGTGSANTTTYTDAALVCGQSFQYRVRGYRSGDNTTSAYTTTVTATTVECNPNQLCGSLNVRVSTGNNGLPENVGTVFDSQINDTGQYVVFASDSNNLVFSDNNDLTDLFRYNRQNCHTESVTLGGFPRFINQSNPDYLLDFDMSASGNIIAFNTKGSLAASDTNGFADVYIRDMTTGVVQRVSVNGGTQGNDNSSSVAISPDARYVAFTTRASNLSPLDNNNFCNNPSNPSNLSCPDIYMFDRYTEALSLVTINAAGNGTGNGEALDMQVIVVGGKPFVVFNSYMSNLVAGDTNNALDVFVRDMNAGVTYRVSLTPDGNQAATGGNMLRHVRTDGNFLIVPYTVNGAGYVRLYNPATMTTAAVQPLNLPAVPIANLMVSKDGQYVFFNSTDNTLVAGDTAGTLDSFVREISTGITSRIQVLGQRIPTIQSIDASSSLMTFTTNLALLPSDTASVCGANGTSNCTDAYVAETGITAPGAPTGLNQLSSTTNTIVLNWTDNSSDETEFRLERSSDGLTWTEIAVLPANAVNTYDPNGLTCGQTYYYRMRTYRSSDNRFSAYSATLTAHTASCTCNLEISPMMVSIAPNLAPGNGQTGSQLTRMSADNQYVFFESASSNLVAGDTNGKTDIFRYDRQTCTTVIVSVADNEALGNGDTAGVFDVSLSGRYVVFASNATNLVAGDPNSGYDLFIRDMQSNTTRRIASATGLTGGEPRMPAIMNSASDVVYFQSGEVRRYNRTSAYTEVINTGPTDGSLPAYVRIGDVGMLFPDVYVFYATLPQYAGSENALFVRNVTTGADYPVAVGSLPATNRGKPLAMSTTSTTMYVLFQTSEELESNDTNSGVDVYLRIIPINNPSAATTELVSLNENGTPAGGIVEGGDISYTGRFVVFSSTGANVVAGDTNGHQDIFVRDRQTARTIRLFGAGGAQIEADVASSTDEVFKWPSFSADEAWVTFTSFADNIVQNDTVLCQAKSCFDAFIVKNPFWVTFGDLNAPTNLQKTGSTPTSITLTWVENDSDESALLVERSTDGTTWTEIASLPPNSTTYTDSTLTCDTARQYRVRSYRSATATYSPYSSAVGVCATANAPSNLQQTASTTTSINLSWTDYVPDETNIRVERSTDGNTWTEIATLAANTTTYQNSGLTCGQTYYYRVRAYRSSDSTYSSYSNLLTGTTQPCAGCNPNALLSYVVNHLGDYSNAANVQADVSGAGRYLAFATTSTNLVPADTNARSDIYRYDRVTCTLQLISVSSTEVIGDGVSTLPKISDNGRYIAFISTSTNLVDGDATNNIADVFVRDVVNGTTERVSITTAGIEANTYAPDAALSISQDGRYVAFASRSPALRNNTPAAPTSSTPYVYDRQTDTLYPVAYNTSATLMYGTTPQVVNIGSEAYVAFVSSDDLTGPTSNASQVYIRKLSTGEMWHLSLNPDGSPVSNSPEIIDFETNGTNFWLMLRTTGNMGLSADTNNKADAYLRTVAVSNPTTGTTRRVSFKVDGTQLTVDVGLTGGITDDGRYIAFMVGEEILVMTNMTGQITSLWNNMLPYPAATTMLSADGTYFGGVTGGSGYFLKNPLYTAPLAALAAPSNPGQIGSTISSITIGWTDNSSDETGFLIEQTQNGTNWTEIGTTAANTTTFTNNTACSMALQYRVRANRSGDVSFSNYSAPITGYSDLCNPGTLTVMPAQASQIGLSWSRITAASEYRVERSTGSGFVQIAVVPDAAPGPMTFNDTGLYCGMSLDYRIRAYRAVTGSYSAYSTVKTGTTTACGVPVLVNPANAAPINNTFTFEWQSVANAEAYELSVASDAAFSSPAAGFPVIVSGTTYNVTTLPADGIYYWRVRVANSTPVSVFGSYSAARTILVDVTPLTTPTGVVQIGSTISSITIGWTDTNNDESGFRIERSLDGTTWLEIGTTGADVTTFTNSTIMCAVTYQYRVRAYRTVNASASSYSTPVTTYSDLCGSGNLVVTTDQAAQIGLSWNLMPGITEYRVERDTGSGFVQIAIVPKPVPAASPITYNDTGLFCGMSINYRMRGYRAETDSYTAYTTVQTGATTACGIPVLVNPANATALGGAFTFEWQAVASAQAYELSFASDAAFNNPVSGFPVTVSGTTYNVTTLPAENTYFWRVRVANSTPLPAFGSYSDVRTLAIDTTPLVEPVPVTPAMFAIVNTARPTFSWNAVAGASGYDLQVNDDATFTNAPEYAVTVPVASHIIPNTSTALLQGDYSWRVRTRNAAGDLSGWSIIKPKFTINLLTSPVNGSLQVLTAPAVTRSVTFSAKAVVGAPSYTFQVDDDGDGNFTTGTILSCTSTSSSCAVSGLGLGVKPWRVLVGTQAATATHPTWTVRISPAAPTTPTLVAPNTGITLSEHTAIPVNAVLFDWSDSNGSGAALTYTIEIDNTTAFNTVFEFTQNNLPTSNITADLSGLNDGQYFWRVRAVNQYGVAGGVSAVRSFIIDTTVPGLPALTAPANGAVVQTVRPTLTWTAASGTPARYLLDISTDNVDFDGHIVPGFNNVSIAALSYTLTQNLPEQRTYWWRLRAVDGAGNEGDDTAPRSFVVDTLKTPLNNAVVPSGTVSFSWAAVPGSTGYQVQLDVDGDADFSTGTLKVCPATPSTALSCAITGVPAGVHTWRVVATNSITPTRSLTVVAGGALSAATALNLEGKTTTGTYKTDKIANLTEKTDGITLKWALPSVQAGVTLDHFSAEFATTAAFNPVIATADTPDATTFVDVPGAALATEGVRYVRVRSVYNGGSSVSAALAFTVDTIAPPKPAPILPTTYPLTTNNPLGMPGVFKWQPSTGAAGYLFSAHWYDLDGVTDAFTTATSYTLPLDAIDNDPLMQWTGPGEWTAGVRSVDLAGNRSDAAGFGDVFFLLGTTPAYLAVNQPARPVFRWTAYPGATGYVLEIDRDGNPDFTGDVFSVTLPAATAYTYPAAQPVLSGVIFWRVYPTGVPQPPSYHYSTFTAVATAPVLTLPVAGDGYVNAAELASASLNWQAAMPQPVNYRVQIADNAAFNNPISIPIFGISTSPAGTTLPLSGVSALNTAADGVKYWRVAAYYVRTPAAYGPFSATGTFILDRTVPDAPTSPKAVPGANPTRPTLSWTAPTGGATSYRLDISTNNFATFVSGYQNTTVAGVSYMLPTALPQGVYQARVRSADAAGNISPNSMTLTFVVNIARTPAQNVVVYAPSVTVNVAFAWTAAPGATNYQVQVDTDGDGSFATGIPATCSTAGLTCTVTGVLRGTNIWRVVVNGVIPPDEVNRTLMVINATALRAPGLPVLAEFASAVPYLSDNLISATEKAAGVNLSWTTPPVTGATIASYEVQFAPTAAFVPAQTTTMGGIASTTTSVPAAVLATDGVKYVRVRAKYQTFNDDAFSAYSPVRTFTVDTTAPAKPVLTAPVGGLVVFTRTPSLVYAAAPTAARYTVELATANTFGGTIVYSTTMTTTSTVVPNSLALPNGTYFWRVTPIDAAGNAGAASLTATFNVVGP